MHHFFALILTPGSPCHPTWFRISDTKNPSLVHHFFYPHFDARFFSLAQNCNELFALDLQEDAMPDAGILCGDVLLIQQKPVSAIHPGNLVLLEENGLPVLCRYLTRSREMIRLAASGGRVLNLAPGGIVLLGCVIGLQRKYNPR